MADEPTTDECRCSVNDLHMDALELLVCSAMDRDVSFVPHSAQHVRNMTLIARQVAGRIG